MQINRDGISGRTIIVQGTQSNPAWSPVISLPTVPPDSKKSHNEFPLKCSTRLQDGAGVQSPFWKGIEVVY